VEALHHLHDPHHQGVCSVAGVFLDILSTNATNITVQGVTVWAARGQDRLIPELRKVDQAPVPGSHWLVWQVSILLESFVTSNSNVILSGLPRLLQNLHKLLGIDLQGPDGPVEVLVDEDRLGGHDVVIRGIAVGAEMIKKASGSKKINKTMLHCAFLLNCATEQAL
jgi:hypothetical protein